MSTTSLSRTALQRADELLGGMTIEEQVARRSAIPVLVRFSPARLLLEQRAKLLCSGIEHIEARAGWR